MSGAILKRLNEVSTSSKLRLFVQVSNGSAAQLRSEKKDRTLELGRFWRIWLENSQNPHWSLVISFSQSVLFDPHAFAACAVHSIRRFRFRKNDNKKRFMKFSFFRKISKICFLFNLFKFRIGIRIKIQFLQILSFPIWFLRINFERGAEQFKTPNWSAANSRPNLSRQFVKVVPGFDLPIILLTLNPVKEAKTETKSWKEFVTSMKFLTMLINVLGKNERKWNVLICGNFMLLSICLINFTISGSIALENYFCLDIFLLKWMTKLKLTSYGVFVKL